MFLYIQDLAATGIARMRKVLTQDNLADLHTQLLPVGRLRYLCQLYTVRPCTVYYNIHAVMQHDCSAHVAHHYHINKLHDYNTSYVKPCITSHDNLRSQSLRYMLGVMMQTRRVHLFFKYCSGLCRYTLACAALFHYSREASRFTSSSLVSTAKLGNKPVSLFADAVKGCDKISATLAVRRKQAQENCGHLRLVNRDCSDAAK